jgi:hypothetical protein
MKENIEHASKGDNSAPPAIRQSLDETRDQWWAANDFGHMARQAQIVQICEGNLFASEVLQR